MNGEVIQTRGEANRISGRVFSALIRGMLALVLSPFHHEI
jgi:hypothetical protein